MNTFATITIIGLLIYIIIKQHQMALSNQELAQKLTDLKAQTEKIRAEVQIKLQALADAIENQGNVSPEVETALAELTTAIGGVDALIEDTP